MARPKNSIEENEDNVEVIKNKEDTNELEKENKELSNLVEEMKKQMEQLQAQMKSVSNQPIIIKDNGLNGKQIKCMNLMCNPLNVSTESGGMGKVYGFEKYGDVRMIRFDDLTNILSVYPYTIQNGLLFICDKEAVSELGLENFYEDIYTKEIIDKIVYLREDSDVDLFIGMEENLKKSTAIRIAELLNAKEYMDFNRLRKIKVETEIDIEEIAKELDLQSN